nr:YoaK family protein [Edaphobacter flagellatus]
MPLFYLRRLTGSQRTETANRHLARYLACVAGAANAGGFLAVRQYTSHMSGIVSAMADNLAVGSLRLALSGLAAVLAFLLGAFLTTLFVRWARRRRLESEYALPLLAEALLLLLFGFVGKAFAGGRVLGTVMLLCFTMGLQNAIITKISDAVIRTTHLTGMVTDIGIALGRLVYRESVELKSEIDRLWLLGSLIALFFAGGVIGALGFKHAGFFFTLPLAAVLLLLAGMPVFDDMRRRVSAA